MDQDLIDPPLLKSLESDLHVTALDQRLKPPQAKPHTSVAYIADDWYIVCQSRKLRERPLPVVPSTVDTDCILVKADQVEQARRILQNEGHDFQ